MSKVVRVLLGIAFLIFLAGVVWSFWAINHKKDVITTQKDTNTQTTITTSTTTQSPTVAAPTPPTNQGVTNKPAPTKKAAAKRFVTYTYIIEDSGATSSAWARSGVNPDGSTYAEAYAW